MVWFPLDPGGGSRAGLRPDWGGRDARAPGGVSSATIALQGGSQCKRTGGMVDLKPDLTITSWPFVDDSFLYCFRRAPAGLKSKRAGNRVEPDSCRRLYLPGSRTHN